MVMFRTEPELLLQIYCFVQYGEMVGAICALAVQTATLLLMVFVRLENVTFFENPFLLFPFG